MSKENDKLIKQFQDYLNYERNFLKKMVALAAGIKLKVAMLKFSYKI